MKLWKKLTAAVLMSAAILGAGVTAKPLFASLTGAEITAQAEDAPENGCLKVGKQIQLYGHVTREQIDKYRIPLPREWYDEDAELLAMEIVAMPGCVLPADCSRLFAPRFERIEWEYEEPCDSFYFLSSVDLSNADGADVCTMKEMAEQCWKIKDIKLPKNCKNNPVTDSLCKGCTSLTSITIPDSVTSIGNSAFAYCGNLTDITIPDSVTSIGNFAFDKCTGLTSITIPDSVTSICNYAFRGCTGLTSITIPDSVTSIGDYAICGCTGLTSITIPDSVKSIGGWALGNCTGLTSITIPDSVTSIGKHAFDNCTGLTSITIPDSVTSIGMGAFRYCTELTSVTSPGSVTSIGSYAFQGCTDLTIYCYTGTYAEQYAKKNNIPFSALEPKQIGGVTLSRAVFQYTGNPVKVGSFITVFDGSTKLKYGTNFTMSYSNNVNCGKSTAKVTVKGIGKYAGSSVTKTYSIAPALSTKDGKLHIEWNKVSGADGYQIQYCKNSSFTGDTLHSTSVTNGRTYCDLVTYPKPGESWCVRVRSFTLTSTGGRKYAAWSGISVLKLNKISNVELKYTAFHYKGKEIKVGKYLKVYSGNTKLVYERDFVLEYKNNVNRGTATVTVKGIGEFAGSSVSKTYKIV